MNFEFFNNLSKLAKLAMETSKKAELVKLGKTLSESQKAFNNSTIQSLSKKIAQINAQNDAFKQVQIGTSILETFKNHSVKFDKIQKALSPVISLWASPQFKERFNRVSNVLIPDFIKKDWYLSSFFLDDVGLENLYYEEKSKNLDKTIVVSFVKYQAEAKRRCLKQFPKRKKIINEIFYCYNKKQYSAVITLVYSTVEGIIYENFNQSFWGSKKIKKGVKKKNFEKLRDDLQVTGVMNIFYKRLSAAGEINKDSGTMNKLTEINSNNRHFVLHGHSYTYGTKKNAVKAILMLDFIHEFVYWEKNWKKYHN